jgi:hypothetical protein
VNPVALSDVVARWRTLTTDEAVRAQALLDDAWEELIELVPGIAAGVAVGTPRPGLVKAKMVAAILPILRNPEGWLEQESAIDDYRQRFRRSDSSGQSARIFSDEAIRALKGVTGAAFEIVPARL